LILSLHNHHNSPLRSAGENLSDKINLYGMIQKAWEKL